ncbi:MAG: hypothetical protein JWN25_141 [Verrucomicrobiales bacterium]|nr:hypothetical protein [Verrucomicrobiales bacterium]MDB6129287.1 hypothetical protein [Verrucomicrobiales bacterium]
MVQSKLWAHKRHAPKVPAGDWRLTPSVFLQGIVWVRQSPDWLLSLFPENLSILYESCDFSGR